MNGWHHASLKGIGAITETVIGPIPWKRIGIYRGWMDGQVDACIHRWMCGHRWIDGWTDERMYRCEPPRDRSHHGNRDRADPV